MKKKISLLIVVFSFFISVNRVDALTLRDLYAELNTLEKNYAAAQNKANMSQAEMNRVKASIANTEAEIKQAQDEITQAEADIVKSEKEIEEKKEETNQMLLYLQLTNSSGNSMLDYVFDADDYTDFIYRYAVVSQMSEHNNNIMEDLKKSVEQLTTKKQELATKQVELDKKKADLQAKYLIVQAQHKDDTDDSMNVSLQVQEKKKRIQQYKSMGCTMDQNVDTCSGMLAVDGWTYPLKSFRQSSNYGWDENRYHYAVDLGAPEGSAVYAVANGEVISSGVYWTSGMVGKRSCGGYVIQIRHNYNGSNYVSLYMHLLSANVQVGSKVTGGQVIGTSGGGPLEIAKYKDACTGGAHLHFTMANGSSTIGSSGSKGSTFDPVKFFPAMKGIGSRL